MNRAIQAEFAPGSTFKPLVALAGLESGVIDDKTEFHCPGGASFYGHYFACHLKRGHGNISLHRAIAQSCDVFFYNVGNKLGIDRLAKYAEMAGLGSRTGIDLPNERESTMPSTRWKLRNYRQKWYAGETISVAIGQGAVTVSPLELAAAIGGLGVRGRWMRPHMVKAAHPVLIRQGQPNPDNVEQVIVRNVCGCKRGRHRAHGGSAQRESLWEDRHGSAGFEPEAEGNEGRRKHEG